MIIKRFENRLNKNNLKFLYQNPVWDNEKKDALNVFEMIDLLNELETKCHTLKKENEQLKKRNDNQYNQLDQLWQLIQEKDWETLIEMDNKMKEDEERLKKEWACYE